MLLLLGTWDLFLGHSDTEKCSNIWKHPVLQCSRTGVAAKPLRPAWGFGWASPTTLAAAQQLRILPLAKTPDLGGCKLQIDMSATTTVALPIEGEQL